MKTVMSPLFVAAVACLVFAVQCHATVAVAEAPTLSLYDDFHYPSEEASERASLVVPVIAALHPNPNPTPSGSGDSADLVLGTTTAKNVTAGDIVFDNWHVLCVHAATTDNSSPKQFVTLERVFERWGTMAYIFPNTNANDDGNDNDDAPTPLLIRKTVGQLEGIKQPVFNLTTEDPDYFTKVSCKCHGMSTLVPVPRGPIETVVLVVS